MELYAAKKTFLYNFFPSKEEEDLLNSTEVPQGSAPVVWWRKLVEIRDVHPPAVVDPGNPWVIKKTLTTHEVDFGGFILSRNDTFEHVIRYWSFEMANHLAVGETVGAALWDATEETNPKLYYQVYLKMLTTEGCILDCRELIKCRNIKSGDKIQMYWDSSGCFKFRLVL